MFTIYQKMLQPVESGYQFEIEHKYWTAIVYCESQKEAEAQVEEAMAAGHKVSEIAPVVH